MIVVTSALRDIRANLALEEYLLEQAPTMGRVLLLYCNDDAVVIGKNQNPWRECNVALVRAESVPLARRISGGGTVFHDKGNLNYSLMMQRREYDQAAVFSSVLSALRTLGVNASLAEGASLMVGDRKISGSAFCFRRDSALHHGTLLISTDLEKLRRLLVPSTCAIDTKAIRSRPAHVANLRDLAPSVTMENVISVLCDALADGVSTRLTDDAFDESCWRTFAERHDSWEWTYGATPRFEATFKTMLHGKRCDWAIFVEEGSIVDVRVTGLEEQAVVITDLEHALIKCRFEADEMSKRLRRIDKPEAAALAGEIERAGI